MIVLGENTFTQITLGNQDLTVYLGEVKLFPGASEMVYITYDNTLITYNDIAIGYGDNV